MTKEMSSSITCRVNPYLRYASDQATLTDTIYLEILDIERNQQIFYSFGQKSYARMFLLPGK